jgi:hypothetical protein
VTYGATARIQGRQLRHVGLHLGESVCVEVTTAGLDDEEEERRRGQGE